MNKENYISARDIAEDVRLNHEIAEELRRYSPNHQLSSSGRPKGETRGSRSNKASLATWIPVSGTGMTRVIGLLSMVTIFPLSVQAETCTATPDCKSLGYTETSCPDDNGVKCPWNPSLMYCPKCKNACTVKSNCEIGDVLYADKKCYICPNRYVSPGLQPIGVVFASGKAVGLVDVEYGTWYEAESSCRSYTVGGVSGWYLPSKDELAIMPKNRTAIKNGFANALDGTDFRSEFYWTSTISSTGYPWLYGPTSGGNYDGYERDECSRPARPVLAF